MQPRRIVVLDGHPDTDRGIGKQGRVAWLKKLRGLGAKAA